MIVTFQFEKYFFCIYFYIMQITCDWFIITKADNMTDNRPVSIDTKYRIEWTQSKHCSTRHVKSCSQIWSYFGSHNNCQWIENQWDSKHQSQQCFRHFDKTEEYFHHALCLECFKSNFSFMTTILENWFKDATTWEIIQIDDYCSCCCNYSIIHHLCSNMSPCIIQDV